MNKVDTAKVLTAYRDWFRQADRREGWFPLDGNLFFSVPFRLHSEPLDLTASDIRVRLDTTNTTSTVSMFRTWTET